jgi:hypothetical protein
LADSLAEFWRELNEPAPNGASRTRSGTSDEPADLSAERAIGQ